MSKKSNDLDTERAGSAVAEIDQTEKIGETGAIGGQPDTETEPELPGSEGAELVPRTELETLYGQLQEKEKELAEYKDKYLRVLADSENARKRMRQQAEESIRMQRENLLRELLPIADNLERALDAARGGGNGKPIVEGVEMVLRSILDLLRSQGVTQLNAVGQAFDPKFHEAVEHVDSPEHPPNTVVSEFHRGYQMGARVLRPARVAVAKGPETEQGSIGPNGKNHKDKNDVEKK